ncbi:TraR/DksA C4-type zinc finger protein [Enterobacterales bacterium AW_CKDN230030176-1A_HGKHYDSX7]
MADAADLANDQAEYNLQVAFLRRNRTASKPSSEFCEDCGDAIPLLRQQLVIGCEACVSCQELRERRR